MVFLSLMVQPQEGSYLTDDELDVQPIFMFAPPSSAKVVEDNKDGIISSFWRAMAKRKAILVMGKLPLILALPTSGGTISGGKVSSIYHFQSPSTRREL